MENFVWGTLFFSLSVNFYRTIRVVSLVWMVKCIEYVLVNVSFMHKLISMQLEKRTQVACGTELATRHGLVGKHIYNCYLTQTGYI